ncbi:MAG TPA: AraC family transcriptional regulator [Gammaproteobacteria bacterium]|jgi:AraC-like DNA-binding protein/DNA gyrase inhibitor GyrI|nr:AraC family transcriptional regulator [Gammaproteobacteria bacterium]
MSYINNTNFVKAVRFIYANIDQPIKLEDIAKAVGISLSSLKRLFIEATHQTPGAFVRRMRMELAFRSLQNRNDSILEVALSAGFDDQSAFARCFKETFGYPPSEARKKLNIVNELDCVSLVEPDIVELTALPLQSVTEQGLYVEAAKKAWHVLNEKLTEDELTDDFAGIFIGIGHDNPHEEGVAEDKVRFTAGVTLVERDLGIGHLTLAGGQYARFHYTGKPINLGLAYHYIYGKWLAGLVGSAVKINNNIPAFIAFDGFPDGLKEQKLLIHVPLILAG